MNSNRLFKEPQGAHKSLVSVECTVCNAGALNTPTEELKAELNRRMLDSSLFKTRPSSCLLPQSKRLTIRKKTQFHLFQIKAIRCAYFLLYVRGLISFASTVIFLFTLDISG